MSDLLSYPLRADEVTQVDEASVRVADGVLHLVRDGGSGQYPLVEGQSVVITGRHFRITNVRPRGRTVAVLQEQLH